MEDVFVIKIGGVAGSNLTPTFFKQISALQEAGKKVIIVHGGGYYISNMLEKLAIPVKTKAGIRITDAKTLEITKMVLIGQVQPQIMTALQQHGILAVGLNAGDSGLIIAKQTADKSLGLVGEVTAIQTDVIELLLANNFIAVMAPLGITPQCEWLNVNADEAACQIAIAMKAKQLILLTDVAGVQIAGKLQTKMTVDEISQSKASGEIYGGMIPKLESATKALAGGVQQVKITDDLTQIGTTIQSEVTVS